MYHNLNTLTIFPERLEHNFRVLSELQPGVAVVPVVKSNAYGHGIKILAPLLAGYDVPFVCVDSLYEAYELEKYGYKKDILIMGHIDPRDIPRRRNFIYAVSTLEYGLAIVKQYSRARLHLFFDTGMHREGIQSIDTTYARDILLKIAPHVEGFMSHLSTPDDITVTNTQLLAFEEFQNTLAPTIKPKYSHIYASGGLLSSEKYRPSRANIARTGLAFYGYGSADLLPGLRCTTKLIQIKHIQKGDAVGYDRTYIAEKPMKIGVLPIGYHDGMDRRLSNIGVVGIGDELCPVVGRVSMNLTTIDISHRADIHEHQEVTLISEDPLSPLSLERQSERAQMIPYDILVHMNKEMYRTISSGTK